MRITCSKTPTVLRSAQNHVQPRLRPASQAAGSEVCFLHGCLFARRRDSVGSA